jgi:hypothetical protein
MKDESHWNGLCSASQFAAQINTAYQYCAGAGGVALGYKNKTPKRTVRLIQCTMPDERSGSLA